MKRRIIAALTALVMVVTMIPASAFAADNNSAQYVDSLLGTVIKNSTVQLSGRTTVEKAKAIYDNLSIKEQGEVKKADEMYAALNAFEKYDANLKAFNDAGAAFKTGKVTPADIVMSGDTIGNDLKDAYTAVTAKVVGKDVNSAKTVTIPAMSAEDQEKNLNKYYVDLEKLIANPTNNTTFSQYLGRSVYVTDEIVTADTLKEITAQTYTAAATTGENYKIALYGVVSGKDAISRCAEIEPYTNLMVNYDNYKAVEAIYDKYVKLNSDVTTLKADFAGYDSVADMKSKLATADGVKTFEKKLAEAEAIVAANGETLKPVDFKGNLYKNFYDAYIEVKAVYDFYKNIDKIENDVRALPSKDAINAMNKLDDVVAVYETVLGIKAKVDELNKITGEKETVLSIFGKTIDDKLTLTETTAVARIKEFGGMTIDKYVAQVVAAAAKLPAVANDTTRADVAAVNEAIEAINTYKAVMSSSIDAIDPYVTKATATDVFPLAGKASLSKTALDADKKFKDAVEAAAPGTWLKIVAASEVIVKKATADRDAAIDVASYIVSTNAALTSEKGLMASAGKVATINDIPKAEKAQAIIAKYNEELAKLNADAKADYDNAVKYNQASFVSGTMTIAKIIETAERAIDQQIVDQEIIDESFAVKGLIDTLLLTPEALIKDNLESQRSQIATIEDHFKKVALKDYFTTTEPFATSYKDYTARKAEVAKYVSESSAVKAVEKAIADLTVITSKDTVDKAKVEAVIKSYETVMSNYEALTPEEQAAVSNYSKLAEVKAGIKVGLEKVFIAEVAKIGNYTAGMTEEQIDLVNSISAMIKDYGSEATPANKYFNEKATDRGQELKDAYSDYLDAYEKVQSDITTAAEREFLAIKPFLSQVATYVKMDKTNAADFVKAVELVNGLSKEAMDVFKTNSKYSTLYTNYTTNILPQLKDAKALLLDYATVTVEDQKYTGEALTPTVVVKNSDGIVIDATEYTVAYSNNTNPGTATVIVTAKADAKVAGTVQGTFKITIDTPVKADITKVDTDYGIVRVYFDRNEEVNGDAVKFQVQYKKTTSDKWIVKYPTAGYDYLTLRNLTKNGKYDVRVRAYFVKDGEKVFGDFSDVKTVYANRNGSKSGIMYKAVIKNLTTKNGSVTMTVNPVKYQTVPQGVTWKYSYKKYGSQYTTWSTAKTTKSTSYTFKNLKKGTRYVFRAQYTYVTDVDKSTAVNSNYSVYKNIVVK